MVYDISQELLGCSVYPGDPAPKREVVSSTAAGASYNLSTLFLCAHNGTHVDAPFHFLQKGRTVEEIPLSKTVVKAFVATHEGDLGASDAEAILLQARERDPEAARRILLKGELTVTEEAAEVFAKAKIDLIGVESQRVGPENAPMAVHLILLGADVVLLEGLRLGAVESGVYLLFAAPIAVQGGDGAPCRAVLMDLEDGKKGE